MQQMSSLFPNNDSRVFFFKKKNGQKINKNFSDAAETQLHKEGRCNGGAYDGSSKTLTVESKYF